VEVKNRTKSFFATLRDYEKTQIHLYMWMTGFSKAKLVEKHNEKIRVTEIYNNVDYTQEILEYLVIFITNFENNFLLNEDKKLEYILLDNDQKQVFLKKLYLNDIFKRANERLENDAQDEQLCKI
jgi:antitoxin component YwqK of YwqJK toxin-antitoxin module